MLLSFGILAILLGLPLIVIALLRLSLSRSMGMEFFIAGAGLISLGIALLHFSEGAGHFRVTAGLIAILTGLVLGIIGCWIGLWGPIAARNSVFGKKFIFAAVVVAILGVATIAIPIDGIGQIDRFGAGAQFSSRIWDELRARRIGPIPFPIAALGAMLAVNGLGLKNGLTGKRLIGANLFILACLLVCYALLLTTGSSM